MRRSRQDWRYRDAVTVRRMRWLPDTSPYTRNAPSVTAAASSGNDPVCSYCSKTAFVLSFDSLTLGSSNASMPRCAPATAVANSQRKNSAARSYLSTRSNLITGWPAASAHQRVIERRRHRRCAAQRRADRRSTTAGSPIGSSPMGMIPLPSLPVLSAMSCSAQREYASIALGGEDRHLVAPLVVERAHDGAERQAAVEVAGNAGHAVPAHVGGARSSSSQSIADDRGGDETEHAQRRVAAADVWWVLVQVPESALARRVGKSGVPGSVTAMKCEPVSSPTA